LEQHNAGLNHYTRGRGPWRLVFLQAFETRKEAEALEKRLKRCNKVYVSWLIKQPVNILDR
ncbi:GIY-YIG nuclease family protein, partial [Parvimonas micra]|uniref:GIY-YIG nuclease family protein n=1 Tax=Parvimonas micra TaxID=33033 RepID=UPI002B4A1F4E